MGAMEQVGWVPGHAGGELGVLERPVPTRPHRLTDGPHGHPGSMDPAVSVGVRAPTVPVRIRRLLHSAEEMLGISTNPGLTQLSRVDGD
jgi:hypothetical protein